MSLNREKKSSFIIYIISQHNQHNGEFMCLEAPQRLETPYLIRDFMKIGVVLGSRISGKGVSFQPGEH